MYGLGKYITLSADYVVLFLFMYIINATQKRGI